MDATGIARAEQPDGGRIATNLRMLLILEALADAREPLTPTQVNARVGLPKQSIHRLCERMVEEGFLLREPGDRGLVPSPRTVAMARGLAGVRPLAQARRAVLEGLSRQVKETVNYVVPDMDGMAYLDRVETHWAFRVELPIGSRVPFHCTASGKCYLASLSPRERAAFMARRVLEPRTANTLTDADALAAELDAVARQGYALDREELFDGMVALAVPVLGASGVFEAAVAFHGPTQRLDVETLMSHLPAVRDAASRLRGL